MASKTVAEIKILRDGGKRLAEIVHSVAALVKPGVTAVELDEAAEKKIKLLGGQPAFKGYSGYPASACISVNEQVVHGIPRAETVFHEGDIVGVDIGLVYKKMFTDMAMTVPVGVVSEEMIRLLAVTKKSLALGITQAQVGNNIEDIGFAIEQYVLSKKLTVVKQLVGHGVGHQVHEPPQVPNFGLQGKGPVIEDGLVIAIEPMVNIGTPDIKTMKDGWTIITADGKPSAHFEHTVAIMKDGPLILTEV